jgi:ATP-binding cassette subfamily A (ABC1) protein 3
VNGAGKTTTFNMIAGITVPQDGQISVAGGSMLDAEGMRAGRTKIGYCPQDNPLIPIVSVEEHMRLYGQIKGLTGEALDVAVDSWIVALNLSEHRKKLAGNLSGGNKRKLCVAIAMIGDPEVILLDEPSAGMDPEARRFMWDVIHEIASTRSQATVVLTTHSMEECEALCSRLAIMVNGTFRCMGTQQEVKAVYGKGRELTLRLVPPDQDTLKQECEGWDLQTKKASASPWLTSALASPICPLNDPTMTPSDVVVAEWWLIAQRVEKACSWVKGLEPEAEFLAWSSSTVRFKISENRSLGDVFGLLEEQKPPEKLGINEYAVSPTTLDEIFHGFAMNQEKSEPQRGGRRKSVTAAPEVDEASMATKKKNALRDLLAHL